MSVLMHKPPLAPASSGSFQTLPATCALRPDGSVLSTNKPASPPSQGKIVHSATRRRNGVDNCRRAEVQSSARLEKVELSILETKTSGLRSISSVNVHVSLSKSHYQWYGAAILIS